MTNRLKWVWKNVKHDHACRAAVRSHDDLYHLATAALDRLRRAPALVRRFFAGPVLQYIRDCPA